MTAHAELGAQVVRSADARRRLLNELDIEFQSLDGRVKSSLDRVWAVFGKVIGRDYLVEASRTLDEMARYLDDMDDLHGYGPATVRAIAVREKALAALLAENEQGIGRVLGAEWLAETRASLERVVWLRELLVRTDVQRKETNEAFAASHVALATTIRRVHAQFESARALETARRQSAEVLSAVTEQERRQRTLLAWLSAIVLLLLLATIVSTVRSVVLPVRRLVRATERLSRGESGVVVPRGGVKELDTLAVSFNQMAERLSAAQELARQYHGQLEAKVEERTRQLQHLAAHDPLTRLPNRRQFLVQLHETLARATERDALAGVFFLDLDNFKNINDSMGHVFGDRVLQAVAERLRSVVRDIGFCARLGGDEFTVVVERVQSAADIERAADRLVQGFQEPLRRRRARAPDGPQPRREPVPGPRPRPGRAAARGRRGAVPRQGAGPQPRAHVQPGAARGGRRQVRHRAGPAPRRRPRRVRAPLPAGGRPRDLRGGRRRGAAALAPARRQPCLAPGFPAGRRGLRPHPRDRRVGDPVDRRARGALARGGLAAGARRGQRVRAAAARQPLRAEPEQRPRPAPGAGRSASRWS